MDEIFYKFVEGSNYSKNAKKSLIEKWKKYREEPIQGKCRKRLETGKNVGNYCGKNVSGNSEYCSTHNNKIQPYFILKIHPILKRPWNSITCFIFDDDNVTVIGKTTKMENGSLCPIIPLDEKDIIKCREIGYPYNLEKVKNKDNDEIYNYEIKTGISSNEINFHISLEDN